MNKFYIIFFCLLVVSCGTIKHKNKDTGYGEGSGSGGSSHKDSIVLNIISDSLVNNYVVINSSNELHLPKPKIKTKPGLKIVSIKNTKVVSTSTDVSEGRVVYQIPDTMKIRSTYRVFLRISKSKVTLSIYDSLDRTVKTSEIPVTQTMEVSLVDPSPDDNKSFHIIADNNAVQMVDSGETFTEWSWNVTPIRIGHSSLKIVVSIIRNGNKKDIVYEDQVKVNVDIPKQALFFWKERYQWIIGTFLLPLFIWLYKRRKDKKEGERR